MTKALYCAMDRSLSVLAAPAPPSNVKLQFVPPNPPFASEGSIQGQEVICCGFELLLSVYRVLVSLSVTPGVTSGSEPLAVVGPLRGMPPQGGAGSSHSEVPANSTHPLKRRPRVAG